MKGNDTAWNGPLLSFAASVSLAFEASIIRTSATGVGGEGLEPPTPSV